MPNSDLSHVPKRFLGLHENRVSRLRTAVPVVHGCDLSAHVHVRSTRTSVDDAGIGSPFWSTGHPECGQMWNASCRSSAVVTAPGDNNNAKFLSVVHFVGHLAKCGLTARPSVISLHHGADPLGTAPQGKMNIGCVSLGPTYSMIPAFAHLAKIGHNAV